MKKTRANSPTKREQKTALKQKQLEKLMQESGLIGYIRALRMHQEEFVDVFVAGIVQFGTDNYIELMVEHLRRSSENNLEYMRILQQSVPLLGHTAKGRKALIDSGAIKFLIDIGIELADPMVSTITTNDER